jgi:hypothetical protein
MSFIIRICFNCPDLVAETRSRESLVRLLRGFYIWIALPVVSKRQRLPDHVNRVMLHAERHSRDVSANSPGLSSIR